MTKHLVKSERAAAPAEYFTSQQIELIKRQICPGASDDELQMFLADCQRSRLDPFARQIYSIERKEKFYDKQTNQWRWRTKRVTQVSIDGFRAIAERTGDYAGQLGPEWCGADGQWRDIWIEGEPAAAKVAVLRKDFEKPLWTQAMFNEYCPRNDKGEATGLWKKMPAVMIAKCAEALSLRRAFPRLLGGLYTSDEMMQSAGPDVRDVTPTFAAADADIGYRSKAEYDAATRADLDRDPIEHGEPDGGLSDEPASAATPSTSPAADALIKLYEEARAEARKGPNQLRKFFNGCNSDEKKELRKIEAELVALYPPLTGG